VIPARNEAATIVRALDAVDEARGRLPAGVTSTCTIVLDSCTDETGSLVRRRCSGADGTMTVVNSTARNVGAARRQGTAVAIDDAARRGVPPVATWLASTDADTMVPAHWLTEQLRLARSPLDAVAGTVELADDADDHLRARFATTYLLGRDGTHRHVHGANMAMRASTYAAAGGWRPLACGEDHDLWRRLVDVGTCVTSTAFAVRTSARHEGRAPGGFAADLAALRLAEPVA
jgi:hypothetical protein